MAKIQIALEQDEDFHGTDQDMADAIALLQELGMAPTKKIVLNLECEDEYVQRLMDRVKGVLKHRPAGIDCKIKTTIETSVDRVRTVAMEKRTPMDVALEQTAQTA